MSLDYRLVENRKAAFVEWMRWAIVNNDCDPSLYMTNYLFDRFEHNLEQKLWICWLYGTTYYFPTTWVIWNEFPDAELVDLDRLREWNSNNYKRLRYQTDTKYNKGFLPDQFKSYKEWALANGSQVEHFRSLVQDTPEKTYLKLTSEVTSKLYKFGRYTTWFYLQTLKHCAGIDMEPPSLLLADKSGSKSHRNGLCYAVGRDEWVDADLSAQQIQQLESEATELLEEVKLQLHPSIRYKADRFAMETCLCSFKKLFRVKRGRYLGYYLDRQAEEISTVERDGWDGIYWKPLWDARKERIDNQLLGGTIDENRMAQFLETGTIDRDLFARSTLEMWYE
jgi:hypothetical protein